MNRKQRRAAAARKPRKVGDAIHATTIAVVDDVGHQHLYWFETPEGFRPEDGLPPGRDPAWPVRDRGGSRRASTRGAARPAMRNRRRRRAGPELGKAAVTDRDDDPIEFGPSRVELAVEESVTKKKPGASRGRPPVPIERDPQRFEIACWWAFIEMGLGKFDAARRALLATKGGLITMEDIEGVLRRASATIPLPQPFDPDDPDKGLRRLSAKAQRTRPTEWLIVSSGLVPRAHHVHREQQHDGHLPRLRRAHQARLGADHPRVRRPD